MMIHRRQFLAGSAAMACPCPARAAEREPKGVPASGTLAFQVARNGSLIGTHAIAFRRAGNDLTVRIDVALRVHFGPITFYRYRHQGIEQWRGGGFATLETQTDDNGTIYNVHAARTADGVLIRATNLPDQLAPATALPLTHWAVACMGTTLFNPENGKLLNETVQPRGPCTVGLADGSRIPATRFALAGAAPIDDYYDSTKLWAALDAKGADGSQITYRRL
jgi:hypothetical protein